MTKTDPIEKLREQHGRLLIYEDEDYGSIAFRKPTKAEYKRFVSQISSEKVENYAAMEALVRSCAVLPDKSGIGALLDDLPAIVVQAAADLQEMASTSAQGLVKKG